VVVKIPDDPRRRLVMLLALLVTIAVVAVVIQLVTGDGDDASPSAAGEALDPGAGNAGLTAYEGLGAWVDVFDFAPAYQEDGRNPLVTVDDVDVMADLGVKTIFLQAARFDDRTPEGLLDPALLASYLERAHQRGMRVVGWYLPKLEDLDGDLERVRAIHEFDVDGQRFDGIALDIEDTESVADPAERSLRLVELSRRIRETVGEDAAVGAIVLPAALLEVVNPNFWPGFPWAEIAPYYDVWMPMTYWSDRREESGYRSGYTYAEDSTRRMRTQLGDPAAPVHPIGGIGDLISEGEVRDYLQALTDTDALGGSIYDYRTMFGGAWGVLREGMAAALSAAPGSSPPPTGG
jgi:hypothetical protein